MTSSSTKPSQDAPSFGCPSSARGVSNAQEGVKETRVADEHLGRLDQSLLHVREPRRKLPYDERAREDVEVALDGRVGLAEGSSDLGAVPQLGVSVREHGPEPSQADDRAHVEAERADISLDERSDEVLAPTEALRVGARQIRAREPTARPQAPQRRSADLLERESAELHEADPSRERLGRLPKQLRRCAPEHEKARRYGSSIREDAQDRKEIGVALNLVDDDETAQALERGHGLRQAGGVAGVLEVESLTLALREDLRRKRRFARLSRAEQRDDRARAQERGDLLPQRLPRHDSHP